MENMDTSDHSVATTILKLNKDCLCEIFDYLDYKSLYNIFKAHKYFRSAVDRIVASKVFTFEISEYENSVVKQMSKFLINFGNRMQGLKIELPAHYETDRREIASLMREHIEMLIEACCAKGNIKYFKFKHFKLSKEFIEDNVIFFKSLRSLEMDVTQVYFDDRFLLLPMLDNVKTLQITVKSDDDKEDVNGYLEGINFGQLKMLQLFGFKNHVNFEKLPISLTITRLELPNCDCDPSLLVQQFPNLEYLEFGRKEMAYSLEPLLNLPKLKHLSLIFCESSNKIVRAFLNEIGKRNVLETFKVQKILSRNYQINTNPASETMKNEQMFAEMVFKMTNLRTLSVNGFTFKYHLEQMALVLKDLERFSLNCIFGKTDVSKELMPKIFKFIGSCEKLEYLTLYLREENVKLATIYGALVKIRCKQKNQKVLNVSIMVQPRYLYAYIGDREYQGKYVKLSCCDLPSSHCDW